ncbi:TadE/TadG family type IV pilus assembly protein [Nakamurella sp. GG22]
MQAGLAGIRRRWRRVLGVGDGRDPDRGSVTTEAVIIVPVVVVLTMVVLQFVLLWHGRHVAQSAAQSAARSAAAYQSTAAVGQADGDAYLQQVAPNLLPGRSVQVNRDATTVTVTVTADVLTVIPFGSFTVDESAAAPVEAFTGGAG